MKADPSMQQSINYVTRFQSLFGQGCDMAFPCDASGHVDLDGLSERARSNYLFARAMVGREYALPFICAA